MSRLAKDRIFILGMGSVGAIMAFLSFISIPVGAIGVLLIIASIAYSYRTQGAVSVSFARTQWVMQDEEWQLLIPFSAHRRKVPVVSVLERNAEGALGPLFCDATADSKGNVIVSINRSIGPFDGEVRVT
ncbi:hypothetical protein [Actinoplanes awajinensis]|uniref:hypothetical protein n=1 Tax=Actinoplanes awajinensis TaxID=135946 RepID=UPI0012F9EC47|nr:hypothetical protein [Actinoplanes awajinensis]